MTSLFLASCGSSDDSADGGNGATNNTGGIDDCNMSTEKVALLEAHNIARASERVCGTDLMPAVPPLEWHCLLEDSAQGHSDDMATENFFSHTGSDGLSAGDRVTNAGYEWRAVGENIAAGQNGVENVMVGWLNSPGHCRNIMNPSFKQIGAGIATNPSADYTIYWTTNYGTLR